MGKCSRTFYHYNLWTDDISSVIHELLYFFIVFYYFLFIILKSIKGIIERHHRFCKKLRLTCVYFYVKGERKIIEDIFTQSCKCIVCKVLKQFRLFSQMRMKLKMIDKLSLTRMLARINLWAKLFELDPERNRLPLEMEALVILMRSFSPFVRASQ